LVVDDDVDARESMREFLEFEGFAVAVAGNGREALKCLDTLAGRSCLILLDLFMPIMSGWEFVEELSAKGCASNVKLVITTSAPSQAPSGFSVLAKPLDPDSLLTTVRQNCQERSADECQ
jgi:CheY-like chemotaxis protein